MIREEITKGNRLIYEFMKPDSSVRSYFDEEAYNHYCLRRGYHGNWNSLMKVVEKIGSTDWSSVDIHWGTGCTDSFAGCNIAWSNTKKDFNTSDNINQDEQSLIKAVWLAIVEFIEWYNNKETKNYFNLNK